MKRHQVMDLFWGNQAEEIGKWKNVAEELPKPPRIGCKIKVRLSDGRETYAYFYKDKCRWIETHGQKPAYFWECRSKEPLFNVVEWKELKVSDYSVLQKLSSESEISEDNK